MVELPAPSVERLPESVVPLGAVVGAAPAAKGMVWPSTVKLSPAATVAALRPLEVAPATSLSNVVPVMAGVVVALVVSALLVKVATKPPRVSALVAAVVPPAAPL